MEKYNNGRRQILMALASLAGGLFLPGTGRAAPQTQEAQRMLVVFYSHTGNTRTIARHIQALTCWIWNPSPPIPATMIRSSARQKRKSSRASCRR